MPYPVPICEIFHVPETGCYGYTYRFEGRKPHFTLDTCLTLEDALNSCDPHREHVWKEPDGSDPSVRMISYGYRFGTVDWIMDGATLADIQERRAASS